MMSTRSLGVLLSGTLIAVALLAACGGSGTSSRMQELNCNDGLDQDGDGLTDCADPDCQATAACGGRADGGPGETNCSNGLDDDDDGSTDCDDRDCSDSPDCTGGEICDDGLDNDDDGYVDCDDADCAGASYCASGSEICTNGIDDDDDGYIDCDDGDCYGSVYCNGAEICDDGIDNDVDGYTDCADSDCSSLSACAPADCNNGQCYCLAPGSLSLPSDTLSGVLATTDASGGPRSGYYDAYEFSAAPGDSAVFEITSGDFDTYLYLIGPDCSTLTYDDDGGSGTLSMLSYTFTTSGIYTIVVTQFSSGLGAYTLQVTPAPAATYEVDCSNGIDDDDNGYTDCEDSYCIGTSYCIETDCGNGLDDDSDGYTDCSDPDCEYNTDCLEPEICDDGIDNDQDGYTDCADTECATASNCVSTSCTAGVCLCLAGTGFSAVSGTTSGTLSSTDPTSGNPRGTGYYYDAYEFSGTAGQSISIEITAGSFDTYLYLIDPTCTQVAYNDDGGSSLLSWLQTTLSTTGTYTLVVTSFGSSTTGTYTLQSGG